MRRALERETITGLGVGEWKDLRRMNIDRIAANLESHLAITILAALGAIAVACGVFWGVRSARRRGLTGEQAGTLLAAAIATGVSAQGMWVFFDKSLHLTLSLRIMFFAFLEIMVLTSALRARSAQQVSGSAGIDGIAMWVLTCLSAVLAATDADNAGTILIRLSAPLVAAWGWERSMALERRRSGALGGINWRITPERILIRLGIADPTDRTAGQAARQRRLIDVALAADRARTLRDTGAGSRRINRARRRLQRVMRRAVEDGGLVDNARAPRTVLMDNLRVLSGTGALVDLDLPTPWTLDADSGTSAADIFAGAALGAPEAAVDTAAVPPQTEGDTSGRSPSPSSALRNSANPRGGQQVSPTTAGSTAPVSGPRTSSAATRTTPVPQAQTSASGRTAPTPAAQVPSTGQTLPAAQPVPAGARASTSGRTLPASAQTAGQPLPAGTQAPASGRSLPAPVPTAGQPRPAAEQTLTARDQTLPTGQSTTTAAPGQPARQAFSATEQTSSGQTPSAEQLPPTEQLPVAEPADQDSPASRSDSTSVSAAMQPSQAESQPNRQYRRDPAFRERVRELHAINAPTSEIADRLGTSARTIRRILADLDAESDTSGRQNRNPAQAAVSNWHNGFRVLPGGNTTAAPGFGGGNGTADERPPHRTDRSMEK